jgi:tRNA(Ile)-lysidine synthase
VAGDGPIVIGVSGGADSVALLLAAVVLRDRGGPGVVAVHVHHHLRGDDADEDAAFVTRLGAEHGVELHVEHVEPGRLTGNVAANARTLRYAALATVARRVAAPVVAVAHHADDQLETILMALCRGAGLDGLSGMAWRTPLDGDLVLVRPMLDVASDACAGLCTAAGVAWRQDPSNDDPDATRTRLRRDVVPVLQTLWPDVSTRAAGTGEMLAAARDALAERLDDLFGPPARRHWPRTAFRDVSPAVVAAGLRRAALDAAPEAADAIGQRVLRPAADLITGDDRRPKRFDWPGGLRLRITAREVVLDAPDEGDHA